MSENSQKSNQFIFSVINGVVHKYGVQSICPLCPPAVVPTAKAIKTEKDPGYEMVRLPCVIQCPKCNVAVGAITEEDIKNNVKQHYLEISCNGTYTANYIEEPIQENQTAPVVKM